MNLISIFLNFSFTLKTFTPSAPIENGGETSLKTLVWSPNKIKGFFSNITLLSSSVYPEMRFLPWSIIGNWPDDK